MVSQLGWDLSRFSSHSLYVGVASTAATDEFSDWEIQSLRPIQYTLGKCKHTKFYLLNEFQIHNTILSFSASKLNTQQVSNEYLSCFTFDCYDSVPGCSNLFPGSVLNALDLYKNQPETKASQSES